MNLAMRLASLVFAISLVACSNKNIDTAQLQNMFQSSPENKPDIDQAVAAINSTNYPSALESLEKVAYRPKLSKEQRQFLQDTIGKVKERIRKS